MSSKLLPGFLLGRWKVEPLRGSVTDPNGEMHHLEPKVMDVFVCLAEHANEVVTREQLLDIVWRGNAGSDEQLTRAISELRRLFHDDPGNPTYIETAPKRGYCLIREIRLADGANIEGKSAQSSFISNFTARNRGLVIFMLLVPALVYVAVNEFIFDSEPEKAQTEATSSTESVGVGNLGNRSIAVLPFINMSDDPGNEYFSEGLSEEIINLLAGVPDLKVIGRTSSFAFKGKNDDLRVIGQTLGVKTLLEGSVRKDGDRVRIVAQLIDVADGTHIWSDTFDRNLDDIFAVQEDVASAVIDAMKFHLTEDLQRGRPTENWQAYSYFLRARMAAYAVDWQQAELLLKKAVKLDPNFAEAYELIAICYWYIGEIPGDLEFAQNRSFEAASTAIAINPDLVFAQALVKLGDVGSSSTLKELEAMEWALREQPDNLQAFNGLVYDLSLAGYADEALIAAQRYAELDPLSTIANMNLFITLYAAGRREDAWRRMDLIYEMGLGPTTWKWTIGGMKMADGHDEAAIEFFESLLHQYNYQNTEWVRELVTAARDPASGQAYLDRRIPEIADSLSNVDTHNWRADLTDLYLYAGFLDRYYELIFADNPTSGSYTDADDQIWLGHMLRRLGFTAHPDYLDLATALGIVDVWDKRGPPDFCRKSGDDWTCD